MTCEVCLVREFASDEAKDALIAYQARQLDRLSHLAFGIPYLGPVVWESEDEPPDEDDEPPAPPRSTLFTLEALLGSEDIFRKPARVAAPRLIQGLADAGLYLTTMEAS